ncbi:MAG TPA: alpha-amylase family glycosyl hydrolase [Rugosimonospora sp.]|nr:alpha-amylase family glycosyl hydrolase [Rugosimonospora sp.]
MGTEHRGTPGAGEPAPDRIADTTLLPPAGRGYHPSPEDWRDEVMYSILIDRFQAGPGRVIEGDPADGGSRHGGNLRGITGRLNYLSDLGVTAIQLSPVTWTAPGTYHGYAPVHLMSVDPRLGRMADLVELIDRAHRRGIRVLLDLVVNHTGPVFQYADGHNRWKDAPAPVAGGVVHIRPRELADPAHFSRRGIIADWKDPEQAAFGDFPPSHRHLATDNPATARLLEHVACWWLRETDADGLRLDAIRHLYPPFLTALCATVRQYAARLGKHNLLIVGEYSSTTDAPIAESLRLGVDTGYNYPEYRRQSWALHGQAPTRDLETSSGTAVAAFGPAHGRLIRFVDNHDVFRFLRYGEPASRLRPALAFLLFSPGIPMLYYGTEQGMRQPSQRLDRECSADRAAPRNREDMFAEGQFTSASSAGDKFDPSSEMFRWTQRLIQIRQRFPALRHGRQIVRWSDPRGPGLYALSRIDEGQEVLVVLNTAAEERREFIPVGPVLGGRPLVDALGGGPPIPATTPAGDPGEVPVTVPAHGVRVLVPAAGADR